MVRSLARGAPEGSQALDVNSLARSWLPTGTLTICRYSTGIDVLSSSWETAGGDEGGQVGGQPEFGGIHRGMGEPVHPGLVDLPAEAT